MSNTSKFFAWVDEGASVATLPARWAASGVALDFPARRDLIDGVRP
jgi:hypothetical protein